MKLTVNQLLEKAIIANQHNNLDEAERFYQKILEIEPAHLVANNNLAVILQFKDKLDEAEFLYQKIIETQPTHPDANHNLGALKVSQNKIADALPFFKIALESNSNIEQFYISYGSTLIREKKFKEAEAIYRKAIELEPKFFIIHFNLAVLLTKLGKLKEAEILYRKAITLKPEFVEAYNGLGNIFYQSNKLEEAEASYKKVIELKSDHAEAHNSLAATLHKLIRPKEAEESLKKTLIINPKHVNALNNLGSIVMERGDYQNAIDCYQKALLVDPNSPVAHYNLGHIFYTEEKYKESILALRQVNTKKSRDLILKCLYKLGDKSLFLKELDERIKEGENNANLGSLISRSEIKFETKRSNPFCGEPLKYALKTDLTKEYDFKNIFVKPIKDILKKSDISSRRQDLLTNGEQTAGNLFNKENDSLEKIKDIILLEVEKYRAHFKDSNEGFLKNWPTNIELKGWIINMKSGGKLSPHIHDYSWLSGSIYINVPPKLKTDSGNLVLSIINEPGFERETKQNLRKIMDVVTGSLCFFPASLHHHTIPFESNEERTVLVFDVIPDDVATNSVDLN